MVRAYTARVGGRTNWLGTKQCLNRSPPNDFRLGHFPKCRFDGLDYRRLSELISHKPVTLNFPSKLLLMPVLQRSE